MNISNVKTFKVTDEEETFCPEIELPVNGNCDDNRNHNINQNSQHVPQIAPEQQDSTFYHKKKATNCYDFSEEDEKAQPKKKQRQIKQPRKRTKPAPWPRIKIPQKVRNGKTYTVGQNKPIKRPEKLVDGQSEISKITNNMKKINQETIPIKTNVTLHSNHAPVLPPKINNQMRKPRKLYQTTSNRDTNQDFVSV